jgi:hypothetical protein
MTRTKSILGLLIGAALCFAAFGASSASAATLHECTEVEPTSTAGRFSDSECTEEAGEGEYATTPISGIQNVKATSTGHFTLTSIAGGIHVVITCEAMESHGTATNEEVAGAMTVSGEAGSVAYTGCTLVETPGTEGCSVPTNLTTNPVTSMTEGTSVKYTPKEGSTFIEIPLENCGVLTGNKKVKGSAKSEAKSPTTQEFNEGSGSELSFGGQPAKLTGSYHLVTTASGTPLYLSSP